MYTVFDDNSWLECQEKTVSWFWAWNFANTLSVNDVIFAKRLTDITPYTDYIEKLTAIFAPDELDDIDTLPEINYPAYSSTNFLSDVYMTRHDYDTLVDVLKMKKNYYFTRCTWSW